MAHKFIDVSEIPGQSRSGSGELREAMVKLAEGVSPGKAVLIDLDKLKRTASTVVLAYRKLIKDGQLPGFSIVSRNRGREIYLVKQ